MRQYKIGWFLSCKAMKMNLLTMFFVFSNIFKINNNNASKTSKSNASKISKTNASKINNRKDGYDGSTYDPLEDDDYNIDEGRPLNNLSRKNLERKEENDNNNYRNPAEWQEMLDQN
ncbi:21401_t:CDS:2 [Cetraspora pellucida]|uniref:21401_t:CDS:1 n=1 Tax=Cetraspora pellucida TaxID=1433469 RepID=A0A9N8WSB3_9GLOM|nr:21401_t:CDS:2 [Cetraspora pellucida]